MLSLTLDTSVLIRATDGKPGCEPAQRILQMGSESKAVLFSSNRVFEHDIYKMSEDSQRKLHELIRRYKIKNNASVFRLSFSLLDGGDHLDGGISIRTPQEMGKFNKLIGKDPIEEFQGNKTLFNKLGDYDSLKDHYASGRDVFITLGILCTNTQGMCSRLLEAQTMWS